MIIDCHTHLNNYTDESVHSLPEDLAQLQAMMRRNRVAVIAFALLVLLTLVDAMTSWSHQRGIAELRARPQAAAEQVIRELGWDQPWYLVSAIGREGTWPIMLEVQAFFDRLREEELEARDEE